jgi:pilus assembly protein CpaB
VVVAKEPIPGGTTITAAMLEEKVLPDDAVGAGHISSVDEVVGQLAAYPVEIGEPVLLSNIAGTGDITNDALSHILPSGQRGMAIDVDVVIGAGGLVLPGDHVDVFWIPNDSPADVPGGQLIAENVEVVAVAQVLVELPSTITQPGAPGEEETEPAAGDGERNRGTLAPPIPDAATVTLVLSPQQVQNVFCGDQAGEIRLAVRQFGDDSPTGIAPVQCVVQGTEDEQAQ